MVEFVTAVHVVQSGDICGNINCAGGHCQEPISRFGDICGNIECIHIWLKRGPT